MYVNMVINIFNLSDYPYDVIAEAVVLHKEEQVVNVRRTTLQMLTITLIEIDCLPVTR